MKRQSTPTERIVNTIIRRLGLMAFAGGAGLGGLTLLLLGREFVALHCTLTIALGVMAGVLVANATIPRDANSWRKAGTSGGLFAALGFALPFTLIAIANFLNLNEASAKQLLGAMTPDQIAQAKSMLIDPTLNPLEYFRGQFVSYIFGYPLVGACVGWLAGMIGGALARRRLGN